MNPPRELWVRWLLATAGAAGLFGLAMVLLPGVTEDFFTWMIFGSTATPEGFSADARDYERFVYGVLGAVMAGWMALLAVVVAGPFRRGERWAWTALVVSAGGWFVVDTAHSLITGYGENAVLNSVFAVAFAVPLVATRPRPAARRAAGATA